MVNKKNKKLAINGGEPVCKNFIPIHIPFLDEDDFQMVNQTTRSTFISGDGAECREFEKQLGKYLGAKHVFFMNSATSALDLAYRVKNFPQNSEVIVPNFTYTSTALGPLLNNLKVVLVDVCPLTGNIDTEQLRKHITKDTVAISPVDYAGNPADMDSINDIAKEYGLYIVHDTAQSLGSKYKGKFTGILADVSTFSFHGTKNLTTGEGGALVTNNDDIAEKVKIARDKGTDKYSFISNPEKKGFYEYVSMGNSYVQSNILGALGISQLKKLDYITEKRNKIANFYLEELKGIPGFCLPPIDKDIKRNWHLFYLLVEDYDVRLWLIDALKAEGIAANVHYNPLHRNKLYSHLGTDEDFPNSIKFFNSLVRLPIYPSLSESQINSIVSAVKKIFL